MLAPDYRYKAPARFALRSIQSQWKPHLAGSPAERWRFMGDDQFDPAAFLDETLLQMKELTE